MLYLKWLITTLNFQNTINGYPHVMLFDKSPNNIVEYNGSREEDALVNWIKNSIKKNMSLKVEEEQVKLENHILPV